VYYYLIKYIVVLVFFLGGRALISQCCHLTGPG